MVNLERMTLAELVAKTRSGALVASCVSIEDFDKFFDLGCHSHWKQAQGNQRYASPAVTAAKCLLPVRGSRLRAACELLVHCPDEKV